MISDTNWHQVVGTWDGAKKRVYIDGKADPQFLNWSGTVNTGGGKPFAIGKLGSLGFAQFQGSMDEVHVSNTARSADWIAAEFDNQRELSRFYSISRGGTNAY